MKRRKWISHSKSHVCIYVKCGNIKVFHHFPYVYIGVHWLFWLIILYISAESPYIHNFTYIVYHLSKQVQKPTMQLSVKDYMILNRSVLIHVHMKDKSQWDISWDTKLVAEGIRGQNFWSSNGKKRNLPG